MKKRTFEHLKNPPAVEAVLDIATNEIEDVHIETLGAENPLLAKKFPKKDQIHLFESSFLEIGKQQQVTYKNRPLGYAYKSEDQKEVVQFRRNGFSYNRLQPYPGWKNFIKSGIEAWAIYKNTRKTLEINRVGLRFINVIKVPDEKAEASKYFKVLITSTSGTKTGLGTLTQFHYKYVREFKEISSIAIVNFSQNEANSFMLDIDVIKREIPKNIDEKTVSRYLEEIRQAKNTIFFDTLSSKALELYRK